MMRLSLMQRVMKTVGEDWSCPFAEQILQQRWSYDPGTVYYFRGSANFLCVFRNEGKRYFLRFNALSERAEEAVEAEVRLVDWLHKQGTKVATPVPSQEGRLVETVTTELGTLIAVVFAGAPGAIPEFADLDLAGFRTWGATLGKLHATMKGAPVGQNRQTWREQLEAVRPFLGDDAALQAEWQYLADWANSLPTSPDDYGLIHFDFELDNLVWQEDGITILDFDDCAHHWYVADIAFALRDLFDEGVNLDDPRFQAFMAGYQEHHPVNQELLVQLNTFLRWHRLFLFGRIARALDVTGDLPEWLQSLTARLQRRVDAYRTSLTTEPSL